MLAKIRRWRDERRGRPGRIARAVAQAGDVLTVATVAPVRALAAGVVLGAVLVLLGVSLTRSGAVRT